MLLDLIKPYSNIKAKLSFSWDSLANRFRNSKGQFVSQSKIDAAREGLIEQSKLDNETLAQRLIDKKITLSQWEKEMRNNLRRDYTLQYLIGKGGKNNMTNRDWGILGHELRNQYGYLHQFSLDISNGRYSDEQLKAITVRMNLYSQSASQAYFRGLSETYANVTLPHYPRGGSSPCLSNCGCYLSYSKVKDGTNITWHKTKSESCSVCINRNGKTLHIRKGKITNPRAWG